MAALVVDDAFTLDRLAADIARALPLDAQPLFVRLVAGVETTGTLKPRKGGLVEDGFDPALSRATSTSATATRGFVPLHSPLYADLLAGRVRL